MKTPATTAGKLATAAILSATLFGFGNPAYAKPVPVVYQLANCPTTFTTSPTGKVEDGGGTTTAASACQYLTPPETNNVASIEHINTAGFFTFTDWALNGDNGQMGPGGLTGTWSIDDVDFATYDYMIVFKDGAGTNLIGFLLNEQFASGAWSSPFTNEAFTSLKVGQTKAVSHFTIAQREGSEAPCNPQTQDCGPREIPEPDGIALMSLGMISAAIALRRRSRRA